jgi:molybdate transport system substrate-binding protein
MGNRPTRSRFAARTATAVLAAALAAAAAGCSSSSSAKPVAAASASGSTTSATSAPAVTGSITVFAASSLQNAFTTLGKDFQTANPGATVTFSFSGSATLAQQITSGAPADVFASANTATMTTVTSAGDLSGQPQIFAKNQLEIAVAPGNPKHITDLGSLTQSGLKVVLCAVSEPCGAAAATVIKDTQLVLTPVSLEADAAAALTKVELGEADAALVYKTDVLGSAGKVSGVNFPQSTDAINSYPIGVVAHAPNASTAQAFVAFVLSPQGQAVLAQDGFQKP